MDRNTMRREKRSVTRTTPSGRGGLFLGVVGLPFFGFGCFAANRAGNMVLLWQEAQSWPPVQARILSTDLKTHTGDDGTTYEVVCTYEYEFGGQRRLGKRVGLSDEADNIGSWQQDAYERLRSAYQGQSTVACYVDPDDPRNAVLPRPAYARSFPHLLSLEETGRVRVSSCGTTAAESPLPPRERPGEGVYL